MKRLFLILLLGACSTHELNIVADLRMSKENAQFYQRDLDECKSLAEQALTLSTTIKHLTENCLIGRGHSIIK
jgi:hypothetical protein